MPIWWRFASGGPARQRISPRHAPDGLRGAPKSSAGERRPRRFGVLYAEEAVANLNEKAVA